jgi:hypothetical protein
MTLARYDRTGVSSIVGQLDESHVPSSRLSTLPGHPTSRMDARIRDAEQQLHRIEAAMARQQLQGDSAPGPCC